MGEVFFVQGIGILASCLAIASFTQKSDKNFKILITASALVFTWHFILLGAFSGAIVTIINATRTVLSFKFHNSNYMLSFFLLLYLSTAFFIYEVPTDLLPIFAGGVTTIALYKLSGIKLRVAFFFTEGAWLIYSVLIKSIGGVITNIFILGTNAVTTYRLLKDKKS